MVLRIITNEWDIEDISVVSVSMSDNMKVLEYVPDCPGASFKQIPLCFLLAWKVFI